MNLGGGHYCDADGSFSDRRNNTAFYYNYYDDYVVFEYFSRLAV